jgi:hypothetical protein
MKNKNAWTDIIPMSNKGKLLGAILPPPGQSDHDVTDDINRNIESRLLTCTNRRNDYARS